MNNSLSFSISRFSLISLQRLAASCFNSSSPSLSFVSCKAVSISSYFLLYFSSITTCISQTFHKAHSKNKFTKAQIGAIPLAPNILYRQKPTTIELYQHFWKIARAFSFGTCIVVAKFINRHFLYAMPSAKPDLLVLRNQPLYFCLFS